MDDQPVETIRETTRNLVKLSRRFHRDEQSDFGRPVDNLRIIPDTIEKIANILKTKSSVSIAELQTLKNGLLEDPKYIEIVLSTHGALRGLVRELTGADVQKQCAAAGSTCNLALGGGRAGATVAKAAGPYLVTDIDSLSREFAVTCTWALGNLAGSGPRACNILAAQGALTKLIHLLYNSSEEMRDAALYALTHFAFQMKDELSQEHISKILEAVSTMDINVASSQLIFIISCHRDFQIKMLPETYLLKILNQLPVCMENHLKTCPNICCKDCHLIYLIRILANVVIDEGIYTVFIEYFSKYIEGFKLLLAKDNMVSHSILWLLGNLYHFNSDSEFFNELINR